MRVEKQGCKGVGSRGFHRFFDLNSKSKKNLVSEVPKLSAQPKQKTSIDTNTQITQYHPVIEDYTSSLSYEDDYGKSPGVVARLMGLDSFPISNLTDTQSKSNSKSNRFLYTQSLQTSSKLHVTEIPEFNQKDIIQDERKHKIVEKFQTEILPSKSARSHKLLSPIKSSGSVTSKDPTRLMEAASRKPYPRRSVESNAARKLKGQSMNKSWDGCLEQKEAKKSVSLAIQAKVNVKKREGLTLTGAKSINVQPIGEKNVIKKPADNRVLKQNNKKQNCVTDEGKSAVNSQSRKPVSDKISNIIPVNRIVDRRKRFTEDVKSRGCVKNDRNGKAAVKSNGLDVVSFTFTSPISGSTDIIKRNSLNLAIGGGYLSTVMDQNLWELTDYSPSSAFQESRISRTIIFEDKRNRDRITKDELCSKFSSNESQVTTHVIRTNHKDLSSERGYVKNILSNIESMFVDFTLNKTSKIVNPHLFDQLEAQKPVLDKKQYPKLRRKLVFDCVSECVESKCRVWLRGLAVVRRKDRLVEHVCDKISMWEQMKDCMVDELVEKDMSSGQRKRWLDFEFEAFEIGVEIERWLLGLLIDEAIVDMLVA